MAAPPAEAAEGKTLRRSCRSLLVLSQSDVFSPTRFLEPRLITSEQDCFGAELCDPLQGVLFRVRVVERGCALPPGCALKPGVAGQEEIEERKRKSPKARPLSVAVYGPQPYIKKPPKPKMEADDSCTFKPATNPRRAASPSGRCNFHPPCEASRHERLRRPTGPSVLCRRPLSAPSSRECADLLSVIAAPSLRPQRRASAGFGGSQARPATPPRSSNLPKLAPMRGQR